MSSLAASSPTILVAHPHTPPVHIVTVQKEDSMIGSGNGDNDVTHVVGEDERHNDQLGPTFAAHPLLGQEGTALNLCPH